MNTENALLHFMKDIYDGLNSNKSTSGLFLDITKAFDTVDHELLLNKLYRCGIRGVVHKWFKSYLSDRLQCVKIGSKYSTMGKITHGVPQGSVLGAVLFIIYINDFCNAKLQGTITSFADDTAFSYVKENWDDVHVAMNEDLKAVQWWFTVNHMILSIKKTMYLNFNLRKNIKFLQPIKLICASCLLNSSNNICRTNECSIISKADNIKYLGVTLDQVLSWKLHIENIKAKLNNVIRLFYFLRNICNQELLRMLYFAFAQSRIEYGIVLWGSAYNTNSNSIFLQQKHLVRVISHRTRTEPSRPLFSKLNILPLKKLFILRVLRKYYDTVNIPNEVVRYKRKLRNAHCSIVPQPKNTCFQKSFYFVAPWLFNSLPNDVKVSRNRNEFAKKLKSWIFNIDNVDILLEVQI